MSLSCRWKSCAVLAVLRLPNSKAPGLWDQVPSADLTVTRLWPTFHVRPHPSLTPYLSFLRNELKWPVLSPLTHTHTHTLTHPGKLLFCQTRSKYESASSLCCIPYIYPSTRFVRRMHWTTSARPTGQQLIFDGYMAINRLRRKNLNPVCAKSISFGTFRHAMLYILLSILQHFTFFTLSKYFSFFNLWPLSVFCRYQAVDLDVKNVSCSSEESFYIQMSHLLHCPNHYCPKLSFRKRL